MICTLMNWCIGWASITQSLEGLIMVLLWTHWLGTFWPSTGDTAYYIVKCLARCSCTSIVRATPSHGCPWVHYLLAPIQAMLKISDTTRGCCLRVIYLYDSLVGDWWHASSYIKAKLKSQDDLLFLLWCHQAIPLVSFSEYASFLSVHRRGDNSN